MRSKAPTWTFMVKATMDEGKSKITEVKVACQERKVKNLRARREKNNSGRIRRGARLRKRSKEDGSGRSGRTVFRAECDQRSAEAFVVFVTISAAKNPSASGSWRRW